MKRVRVRLRLGPEDERELGELAEVERGRTFFEYAPAFLATGWQPSTIGEISRAHQRVTLVARTSTSKRQDAWRP